MDFGKLTNVDQVDFTLPPDAPQTASVIARSPQATPVLFIGCPVWNNPVWVGKWYPAGTRSQNFLRNYARQFNTIELNSTHYGLPDVSTVRRWKNAVSPPFTFCPKIPQQISHEKQLVGAEALTEVFCAFVRSLSTHAGMSFLQLPPTFTLRQLPALQRFLTDFPADVPLSVEFRHPDWFAGSPVARQAFDWLEAYQFNTVITDVAGRRDVLHQRLTTPVALIRFVGNNLHATDFSRIDAWTERIGQWYARGLQQLYFFVHEPDNTHSPELAAYLIQRLNRQLDLHLAAPTAMATPVQTSLFD